MQREAVVPECYSGTRLDQVLVFLFPGFSRAFFQSHIEGGRVLVNGQRQKKRHLVEEGDTLTLFVPPLEPSSLIPEPMSFDILFEDGDLFAINKPPHLVVHPAPGHRTGTFVHGFLSHVQSLGLNDPIRPGIIHRLDKDTSGVLLAAKNREALYAVARQFHDRKVGKEYFAIVLGEFTGQRTIEGSIARDPTNRKRMAILETGKESKTEVFGVKVKGGFSLVKAVPYTGRTHQVRVHLRSIGLSILGDDLYGQKEINKKWGVRQMLHCSSLIFSHPRSGEKIHLEAPFFKDMEEALVKLGFL
jgi:23S rRNA pseudouridine1911/1915/1917 synthase